jgi:hypothetical protein
MTHTAPHFTAAQNRRVHQRKRAAFAKVFGDESNPHTVESEVLSAARKTAR